jgi:hypothetical protein
MQCVQAVPRKCLLIITNIAHSRIASSRSRLICELTTDDARRPVWLEATQSFYRKLNRIAKICELSRYEALSKGLDALLREAEIRSSALNRNIKSPAQSEVFRRTMGQVSRNYWESWTGRAPRTSPKKRSCTMEPSRSICRREMSLWTQGDCGNENLSWPYLSQMPLRIRICFLFLDRTEIAPMRVLGTATDFRNQAPINQRCKPRPRRTR